MVNCEITGAMLYPLTYQATWIDGQLWDYRCNALSTELPSHMDRWSIVRLLVYSLSYQVTWIDGQLWDYRCNGLFTELPSHMDRWSIVRLPVQCSVHWATKSVPGLLTVIARTFLPWVKVDINFLSSINAVNNIYLKLKVFPYGGQS